MTDSTEYLFNIEKQFTEPDEPMTDSEEHLSNIQKQFTEHGDAYKELDYVSNEVGLQKIVALAEAQSTHTALDVACGPGYLSFAFAETCSHVVGVDITDAFLDHAREHARTNNIGNIEFSRGNVEKLTFDDNTFDICICRAAFHHFIDQQAVLREMKRVTKSGGRILVLDMIVSENDKQAKQHNKLEMLCDPTHVRARSESEFKVLFKFVGLDLLSTKKGQTKYPVDQWIKHGGPSPENETKIRKILNAALDNDTLGIPVFEKDGELHLGHNTCVFVLGA